MSADLALPSEQQTEVEKPTIGKVITWLQPELQRALPRGMSADRLARVALTMVRATPKLAQCTPESFAGALLTSAALGLEPGVNGESYLVPYEDKRNRVVDCQLIIGYQGFAKLFWNSPAARHLDAQAVFERDAFDYEYGLNPYLRHRPADGDRGRVTHYYAVATLANGGSSFVVLTADEVKKLRGGKVGPSGNIADPMRWMERKTALRQLLKIMPRSTTLNAAMEADEALGTALREQKVPESITAAAPAALNVGADEDFVIPEPGGPDDTWAGKS